MADIDLDGKFVLLTGGGGGLGRVMAHGLAARGAKVAVLDINRETSTAVAEEIVAANGPGSAIGLCANIAVEADCQAAIRDTTARLGGLNVLINNAALGMAFVRESFTVDPPNFWECPPDTWQAVMDANVRGTYLMSYHTVRHLMDQGWGRIVNVTTSLDSMYRGGNMPYGQSKAAIEAASVAWSQELDGTGVTVNVLIPGGAADTTMIPASSPYDRSKLNSPSVMVAPICWLASDASDGVTGRRFIGRDWDPGLPPEEAAEKAGSPGAWVALGGRKRDFT